MFRSRIIHRSRLHRRPVSASFEAAPRSELEVIELGFGSPHHPAKEEAGLAPTVWDDRLNRGDLVVSTDDKGSARGLFLVDARDLG